MNLTHRSSILLAIGGIVGMFILWGVAFYGGFGNNVLQQDNSTQPLIVPAGYAFSIWSIIYAGLIVFPIYQLLKQKDRKSPLWMQMRVWFTINVLINGLWLVFAQADWIGATVILIIGLLLTLIQINALILKIKKSGEQLNYWTEELVFNIYFAWVTLATALNVSAALKFYQWEGFGISDMTWTVVIMIVAAIIAGAVFWKYRKKTYAIVVIWAFAALFVKHANDYPQLGHLAIGIILIFIGFILFQLFGKKSEQIGL